MKQKTMDSLFSFDFLPFSKNSWTAVKTKKIRTEIDDKILCSSYHYKLFFICTFWSHTPDFMRENLNKAARLHILYIIIYMILIYN